MGVVVQVTHSQGRLIRLHWLPNCSKRLNQRTVVASSILTSRSDRKTESVSNKDDVIERRFEFRYGYYLQTRRN